MSDQPASQPEHPPKPTQAQILAAKNARVLRYALMFVAFMVGVSFASVPLYDLFCRATGYGGTTQEGGEVPKEPSSRTVQVRFNADVNADMPWNFKTEQRDVSVRLGEQKLISYVATNPTTQTITGTAIYNVTPPQAGKYFHKTQCFCFQEQVLNPGKTVHMPVMFWVDPKLNDDPELRDLQVITLSYTFFKADSAAYDAAFETFSQSP